MLELIGKLMSRYQGRDDLVFHGCFLNIPAGAHEAPCRVSFFGFIISPYFCFANES